MGELGKDRTNQRSRGDGRGSIRKVQVQPVKKKTQLGVLVEKKSGKKGSRAMIIEKNKGGFTAIELIN